MVPVQQRPGLPEGRDQGIRGGGREAGCEVRHGGHPEWIQVIDQDIERPDPEAAESGPRDDASAEDDREDAVPGGQDDEAAPGSDPDDGDAPDDEDAPADAGGEAGDVPDPALVTGLIERLDQVRAAADAAELVLTASGDLKTVLAGLDEIYEQAAQARRVARAAAGGKKAPAARPGGLREKVLAHLRANPGSSFTPHEIHKVTGHSSGAIANALDTLVKHGDAELAAEKPRRFRLAGNAATPIGGRPPAEPGPEPAGAGKAADLVGAA